MTLRVELLDDSGRCQIIDDGVRCTAYSMGAKLTGKLLAGSSAVVTVALCNNHASAIAVGLGEQQIVAPEGSRS